MQLVRDEERTVSNLADQFTISRPAISQHLKVLQDACVKWLTLADWAEGLAIKVEESAIGLWIFVIPKDYDSLTIDQRREVAAIGLALTDALGARVESRLCDLYPVDSLRVQVSE